MAGGLSPQCSSSNHGQCPGYYLTAHTCECACHRQPKPALEPARTADLLAKLHADTRIPPPELIQQVNKGSFVADAVGHADTTDMILAHDPAWSWEPFSLDDKGQPLVMYDTGGRPRAMWIRLTIHGHSRIGIGTCTATAGDPYKELIGDAIRNAAMRFGVALALWSKSEWSEAGDDKPRPEERSQSAARGSAKDNAPRVGNGPTLPPDQAIAALAEELGVPDAERRAIILAITDNRTDSGKELRGREAGQVIAYIKAAAKAKRDK